jgi:hypothetical protein
MAPLTVLSHLFPHEGVQLGRLVTSLIAPQSLYYPPGRSTFKEGEIYSVTSKDYADLRNNTKDSNLESVLTSLASALHSSHDNTVGRIGNTVCITYFLDDAEGRFGRMSKDKSAQAWFENAYKKRKHVYLVTAIQTLTEASLELKEIKDSEVKRGQPSSALQAPLSSTNPSSGDRNPLVEERTKSHRITGFIAEGEQIYAIQYRRVKFRLLYSRNLDKAALADSSRWKVMWKTMGGKEEENDTLEVTLNDDEVTADELERAGVSVAAVNGVDILYTA